MDDIIVATSRDGGALKGVDNGHNFERTDQVAFYGPMLESADSSYPFISFITLNLEKLGGTEPNGTEAKFTFSARGPDGMYGRAGPDSFGRRGKHEIHVSGSRRRTD